MDLFTFQDRSDQIIDELIAILDCNESDIGIKTDFCGIIGANIIFDYNGVDIDMRNNPNGFTIDSELMSITIGELVLKDSLIWSITPLCIGLYKQISKRIQLL
jgi:DNA topoisomerase VI subunit A